MKNIILDSTTKSLEAVMSAAVVTTAPNFVTSYTVFDPDDASDKLVETSSDGVLNGTTAVTLVAAPAIGERVVIGEVAIYNADSVSIAVSLRLNNNGVYRVIKNVTITAGNTWLLSIDTTIGTKASDVSVADADDYFVGTNVENVLAEIGETKFYNGFDRQTESSMPDLAFNSTTRTFSCSVKSGASEYHFWAHGKKFAKTSTQSVVIPNVTATYYIYFDNVGTIQYVDQTLLAPEVFYENAIAGIVYWNATTGIGLAGNELHGIRMSASTHNYNHNTYGARYAGGMNINGLSNGSDVYTSVDSGEFWDEDVKHTPLSQTDTPFLYRLGADGEWNSTTPDLNVSYNAGGTWDVWNEWNGAAWQLSEGGVLTDYWIIFLIATPDISGYVYKKIIGQNAYPSRSQARNAITTEKSRLVTDGLPSPEFVFLFAWIVKRDGTLEDDGDGNVYYDLRTEKGGVSGSGSGHDEVTLAGTLDYLTLSGQVITLHTLDMVDDVSSGTATDGQVPAADGAGGIVWRNGGLTYTTETVTTSNVTGVEGHIHDLTIAGLTSERKFALPTPSAAGVLCGFRIIDGDDTYSVMPQANSVDLDGYNLFQAGESLLWRSTGTGAEDWEIAEGGDGRIKQLVRMTKTSDVTSSASATWTNCAFQTVEDVRGFKTVTGASSKATTRRMARFDIRLAGEPAAAILMGASDYYQCRVDDGAGNSYGRFSWRVGIANPSSNNQAGSWQSDFVPADSGFVPEFRSSAADAGFNSGDPAGGGGLFTIVEIL